VSKTVFFLICPFLLCAQYYEEHFIAPAPWQYWSSATEIVLATQLDTTVDVDVLKSDGSRLVSLKISAHSPVAYRFTGMFNNFPRHSLDRVIAGAGIYLKGTGAFSVNIRNVASDQLGVDTYIKGNASLTSLGDPGIGLEFRIGYYRDGPLPRERPIYSIMALHDKTILQVDNRVVSNLEKGESYLFRAAIGSHVVSSKPCVMNTGAFLDAPGGCGDGTFDQIPPIGVLGKQYFVVRTQGNQISEQSTIVSTSDDTKVNIIRYDQLGNLVSQDEVYLQNAGDFITTYNGDGTNVFSVVEFDSDKKLAVYCGSARSCEVDVSTSFPVSSYCNGSNYVETIKFTTYRKQNLPYFCYVLIEDSMAPVLFNGVPLEGLSGQRQKLEASNMHVITCTSGQLGSPDILTFSSDVKLHVVIIQLGGGFSMSATFSNFIEQPLVNNPLLIRQDSCPITSVVLNATSTYVNYQWYFNGELIVGAMDSFLIAKESGIYHLEALLDCGDTLDSRPLIVTLDTLHKNKMVQTSCNDFVWEDSILTKSGNYERIFKTKEGCDSLASLDLTIIIPDTTYTTTHACSPKDTGKFVYSLKNVQGCDSVIIQNVWLAPSTIDTINYTVCVGDSLFLDGEWIKEATFRQTIYRNQLGCDSAIIREIEILDLPDVIISGDTLLCSEDTITLTAIGADEYVWSTSERMASIDVFNHGLYSVIGKGKNGCYNIDSIKVKTSILNLDWEFMSPICFGEDNGWIRILNYKDDFEYFLDGQSIGQESTNLSAGNYLLEIVDNNGCTHSQRFKLESPPPLLLELPDSLIGFVGTKIDILPNKNRDITRAVWTPPVFLSCYSCFNTSAIIQKGGRYYHLKIVDENGCEAVDSVYIAALRRNIYAPNVFTPNGDFLNDKFTLFSNEGYDRILKLQIFDRWGELIYEGENLPFNNTSYGWDGQFHSTPSMPGVYVYVAEVLRNDEVKEILYGDVTLLK